MTAFALVLIFITLVLIFFGYYKDYKRDKKYFIKGMIVILILAGIFVTLITVMRFWLISANKFG